VSRYGRVVVRFVVKIINIAASYTAHMMVKVQIPFDVKGLCDDVKIRDFPEFVFSRLKQSNSCKKRWQEDGDFSHFIADP
jgi:hypothetical protein